MYDNNTHDDFEYEVNNASKTNIDIKVSKLGKFLTVLSIVLTVLLVVGVFFEFWLFTEFYVLKNADSGTLAEPIGMVFTLTLYVLSVCVCGPINIINLLVTFFARKKMGSNSLNNVTIIINASLLFLQAATFIFFLINNLQ